MENSGNSSSDGFGLFCFFTSSTYYLSSIIYYIVSVVVLLPPCLLVLRLRLLQWHRSSSGAAPMSHSDVFTLHVVVLLLFCSVALLLCCYGTVRLNIDMLLKGYGFWAFSWFGELLIHILTCAERYLAVVHPITYRSLRGERGARLRNILIGCIWLLCAIGAYLTSSRNTFILVALSLLSLALITISYCSLAVLYVLVRPGLGKESGARVRIDQSKKRAFYTIMAILVVLLMKCVWCLVWAVSVIKSSVCLAVVIGIWFSIPSTVMLPLLYLVRAYRPSCSKSNSR